MTAYIELFIRGNVRGEMSGYLITITIMTSPQNIASTIQVLLRLHLDNNSNKKKSPFTFFRYLGLENLCGVWWLIGRFDASCPKGHGFKLPLQPPRRDLRQVLHSQLPVALRCETPTQYPCSVGSTSE